MKRIFKSSIAISLLLTLMLSLCSFTASASGISRDGQVGIAGNEAENGESYTGSETTHNSASKWQLSVSKVANKNVWSYSGIKLTLNGSVLNVDARMINDTAYVAVRSFIETTTNMTVTYYSSSRILDVNGGGLTMRLIDGSNVIYANSRTLFSMTPAVIMNNGRMYAPLSIIAKVLGLKVVNSNGAVKLSGSISPLVSGDKFYAADAVYWLSRIISAESAGESLIGQIAVGNVVLNRVDSSAYPSTIWGVIFDRKYGVQFSPVLNGSIYNEPTASAITAAKICLEGYTVTNESMFFLNPTLSTSSWIVNNRTYLFSIGKHDFYK